MRVDAGAVLWEMNMVASYIHRCVGAFYAPPVSDGNEISHRETSTSVEAMCGSTNRPTSHHVWPHRSATHYCACPCMTAHPSRPHLLIPGIRSISPPSALSRAHSPARRRLSVVLTLGTCRTLLHLPRRRSLPHTPGNGRVYLEMVRCSGIYYCRSPLLTARAPGPL